MSKRLPCPAELFEQPILDVGYVRYVDHFGDDDFPLEAARMSTNNPTGVDEAKDDALRDRLYRDGHVSPFEFGALVLEVQAPIFVARQIFRHRSFSMNEFSARYSEMPEAFHVPGAFRGQSKANHQMGAAPLDGQVVIKATVAGIQREANRAYARLLEQGVAREDARIVLPVGQYTRWRMQGNPRTWMMFLALRLPSDVQPQTREVADACARVFAALYPKTWAVFKNNTLDGTRFSGAEMAAMRLMLKGEPTGLDDKARRRLEAKLFGEVTA